MKTKIITTLVVLFAVLSMIPLNLCFAQSPEITREYIARNIGGMESHEEKVTADYKNLQFADGDYVKVSFLDGESSVLDECYIEIDIYNLSGLNMSLSPETLAGTEYIEITVYGYNSVNNGVKLPFKIYKKMEEEKS